MPDYIREAGDGAQLWRIDDEAATNLQQVYSDPTENPFRASAGRTPWDELRARTPWFDDGNPFHELKLNIGEHYPRIARPLFSARDDFGIWSPSLHTELDVVAASQGQARSLLRQLERICQTVQPGPRTFEAFGHDIRNLLVLACMEIETHWRGVLVANGARRRQFSTSDYVKLAEVLQLRAYAVRFPAFPTLESIRPFETWGQGAHPTSDLPWYAAYNAVKHNREGEFEKASLQHAFQAMSGCAVMLVAQYGKWGLGHQTDLSAFFHLVERPEWPLTEAYVAMPGRPQGAPAHEAFAAVHHPILADIRDRPRPAHHL